MVRVDLFNAFLDQVCDQFDKVMISGDFDMPHISWNNTGEIPSTSDSFIEALYHHFLTQIKSIPTRDITTPLTLLLPMYLNILVPGHFAERHFAERHFAERHFAERTFCRRLFCRTDVLPNGHFAERTFCRTDSLPKGQLCNS